MKCNRSNSLTALPPYFYFCINFVGYSWSDDGSFKKLGMNMTMSVKAKIIRVTTVLTTFPML